MAKKEKKEIAILMYDKHDTEYGHVLAQIIEIKPGDKVRNYRSNWDDKSNQYFDGLYISCQIDKNSSEDSYAWNIEYKDKISVDLSKCEKMVKTLRSVIRKKETIENQFGRPESYGQFVVNFANAIGTNIIVFYTQHNSSSYDECKFNFSTLSNAKGKINQMVKEVKGKLI